MAKYKALLFDLDGTLVDSEPFHFGTWNALLAESNVQLEYTDFLKNYAGIPIPGNAARLKELYGIETPIEVLISRKEEMTVAGLQTSVIGLMPHVQETLDFFRSRNIKMALVTASTRNDVNGMFRNNRLDKYFDLMITRTDVTKSKPDPECYNMAVEKLGLEKSECLVFEDTLNGLRAAKAAELTCFAIQHNTDDHEKLSAADKIFLDFKIVKDFLIENDLV